MPLHDPRDLSPSKGPARDSAIRTLRILHRTLYTYDRPVAFGEHRLMIRPRDGHDMRILESSLTVSPRADVHWAFDTFSNSIALLSFHDEAAELMIESELLLRRYGLDEPLARFERYAGAYPVEYDADERIDLGPYMMSDHPQDKESLAAWMAQVLPQLPGGSLQVLGALGTAIHVAFRYARREAEGVQTPTETIARGSGTCRDFALLFMESARSLGFAARFVTGYLHDEATANGSGEDMTGGGATHAWADVFVPGAGWVEFDPTNRIIACRNLIRVATTRSPLASHAGQRHVRERGRETSWRAGFGQRVRYQHGRLRLISSYCILRSGRLGRTKKPLHPSLDQCRASIFCDHHDTVSPRQSSPFAESRPGMTALDGVSGTAALPTEHVSLDLWAANLEHLTPDLASWLGQVERTTARPEGRRRSS